MSTPLVTFDLFSALVDSRTGASRILAGISAQRRWGVSGERVYDEWDRRNKASQRDERKWIPFAEHCRHSLMATYADLGLSGPAVVDAAMLLGSVGGWPLWPGVAAGLAEIAARLSPFKMANKIDDDELVRLYDAMRATLTDALDRQVGQKAATMKGEKRSGLTVHARTGLPCPVCGDTVREVSFADTSLQYCPTCQTGGKPLADRRMSKLLR